MGNVRGNRALMRILIVSSFLLFEETRFGGSKRLYYFANELKNKAEVDLIMFDACNELSTYSPPSGFANIVTVKRKKKNILERIFFLDIDFSANDKIDVKNVLKFVKNKRYDAVLIAFPYALSITPYVMRLNKNITYLEDDLFFEQYKSVIKNGKPFNLKKALKAYKLFWVLKFYHHQLINIRKWICISEQEKTIIKKEFPYTDVFLIKYGIELNRCNEIERIRGTTIGFIGNYNHLPNLEALNFFFLELYPKIKTISKTLIAGKNIPPDLIKTYQNPDYVSFMENPDSIDDFYKNIDIFINPIVSGRGLRTKLIEAAWYGKPIVSTSLGAEGLEDLELFVADKSDAFIENIQKLFSDNSLYKNIVNRNKKVIEENYTSKTIGEKVFRILLAP
jgi:glycosyltransferase involved in cell wall biosynthesis